MAPFWVVLKFGGTSVSTPERWATIAELTRQRISEGLRPVVVCSALSGISNKLDALLGLAVQDRHDEALAALRARHLELGRDLGVDAAELLRADFEELSRLLLAASLLREAGPALKARVMAFGELMSTRLGAAFLTSRGIETDWHDARTSLTAREDPLSQGSRAYLSATCDFDRDEELIDGLSGLPGQAVITQGFIARNREGQTVLLGRGGSDTSAAYFAARLGAARCEIWTDVPGLFTANPALIPSARLLRALTYEEAQEIAGMGAKVLHPRAIAPCQLHGIPLHVLSTDRPDIPGTVISASGPAGGPQVKAVSSRNGLTLVSLETVGMWQQVGFLAQAFEVFARHGLSVDSVSTSETNVTVTLDPQANTLEPAVLPALLEDLSAFCTPRVVAPASSLSLVGRGIRAILHELGPVLEVFEELKVYLLTQAANDLNLTFVVDEEQSERLVRQLHGLLFAQKGEGPLFGPSWSELFGEAEEEEAAGSSLEWWRTRRTELLDLQGPVYAYDAGTLRARARVLRSLDAVSRVFYSVKANNHPGVLRTFQEEGLGFECVSAAELDHVRSVLPEAQILFTPNFAPREEYVHGFEVGAQVTLDNLHPLVHWPEVFRGREVFLRLDPGRGRGHHSHVRTAGAQSKFGLAPDQLEEIQPLLQACGARVVGLHAPLRQRRAHGGGLERGGDLPRPGRRAVSRRTGSRSGGWPRRAGAARPGAARPRRAGGAAEPFQGRRPALRAVAGARPLPGGGGRGPARPGHPGEAQGRGDLRGPGDGHQLADPPASLWRLPPHREPLAVERARHLDRPRRGAHLRDGRYPRPLAPPASDVGRGRPPDRQRRGLWAGHELPVQPAGAGGGSSVVLKPASPSPRSPVQEA